MSLGRIEEVENKISARGKGRIIIQKDCNRLENELEKTRSQIFRLQTKYEGHSDEVVTTHVRLSTIEMIIEDIRGSDKSNIGDLLEAIQDLKNNKESN